MMYREGQGVAQDYEKAVKWFRLAAAQGFASAQYNLGNLYDSGHGVKQDYAEAVRWFRLAAAQEDAAGQSGLGAMYATGHGVPQDYTEALKLYRLAAAQGLAKAQYNLGVAYHMGQGVPQNDAEAAKWFRLGGSAGAGECAIRSRHDVCQRERRPAGRRRSSQVVSTSVQSRGLRWRNTVSARCITMAQASPKTMFAHTCGSISALRLAISLLRRASVLERSIATSLLQV